VGVSSRTAYLLLLPGAVWLFIFFVVPLLFLLSMSLQTGSLEEGYKLTFAFSNYEVIWDFRAQFLRSFLYAGLATLLCLIIAYPLAYTIAFKSGRWKGALLVAVIAPFFTSFLIRTLAWLSILQDDGPVVSVLNALYITDLFAFVGLGDPDRVLATPLAVITGLTYNFLPFMVLPLYAALDRMDPRLVEAAQDLYSSPWTAFRKVTFPLSMPGVIAGTLLTFIPAAGDYINATLLGNTQTRMIGNVIEAKFFGETDYPSAAALSFVLMLAILVMVGLYVRSAGTDELV
jgi:spermidine/putrescine transport system permease protein